MDLPAEIARIENHLDEQTRHAGVRWLDEVTRIVPVWSSASHATFVKVAKAVGYPLPVRKVPHAPERYMLGYLNSQGGIYRQGQGRVHLLYATQLRYLAFNNDNVATPGVGGVIWGLIKPTPYKFVQAGQAAFMQHARTVRLPLPRFRGVKI